MWLDCWYVPGNGRISLGNQNQMPSVGNCKVHLAKSMEHFNLSVNNRQSAIGALVPILPILMFVLNLVNAFIQICHVRAIWLMLGRGNMTLPVHSGGTWIIFDST